MDKAYVKNLTNITQRLGYWEIGPGAIGLPPSDVLASIRSGNMKELVVLDDHPDTWIFKQTEHQPFSPRYIR